MGGAGSRCVASAVQDVPLHLLSRMVCRRE